ncbi:MAG: hypothetical protein NZ874_05355 [Fimbriimonadales bacterium]|nr:hypothetical protein [Fimbriimonadales bacterium]
MRVSVALWIALAVIVILFAASLTAVLRAGGSVFAGARTPQIQPQYRLLDSKDILIEGCVASLPSGEQEVRLKLYNTGLSALRNVRIEVKLDDKSPKAPQAPIFIRRFPRRQQPEVRLLFDKTDGKQIALSVSYQWGLMGSGAGGASIAKPIAPCPPAAPSQ